MLHHDENASTLTAVTTPAENRWENMDSEMDDNV